MVLKVICHRVNLGLRQSPDSTHISLVCVSCPLQGGADWQEQYPQCMQQVLLDKHLLRILLGNGDCQVLPSGGG